MGISNNRIETNLLGLKFRGPCIVGSSFLTGHIERIKRADRNGAGGVSTKMALLQVPFKAQSNLLFHPNGIGFTATGDKRMNLEAASRLVRQVKQECSLVVLSNIVGPGVDLDGWQRLALGLEEAGADAIELDISCPNLPPGVMGDKNARLGSCVAQSPELSRRITRAVKDVVHVPVLCKLTAAVASIQEVAMACEEAGADGITAINAVPAVPPIDIRNKGKAPYVNVDTYAYGALAGPAIFPISCRAVADIYKVVKIPVIGCGGVSSWKDAVTMIMWGASAVQMVASITLNGYEVIAEINRGVNAFMEDQGYSSIEDFRGLALKYAARPEEMEYKDPWLLVHKDRCSLCMRCLRIGQCLAISLRDGAITLDNDLCIHCGTCLQICPQRAIDFQEVALPA